MARWAPGLSRALPWHLYVDGEMVRNCRGVGVRFGEMVRNCRGVGVRFKTAEAALAQERGEFENKARPTPPAIGATQACGGTRLVLSSRRHVSVRRRDVSGHRPGSNCSRVRKRRGARARRTLERSRKRFSRPVLLLHGLLRRPRLLGWTGDGRSRIVQARVPMVGDVK
jgi:hypothetical protein